MAFQGVTFYGTNWAPTPGFDPAKDSEQLYYAMKGIGCDDKKLVFLGARNPLELETIKQVYRQKFDKDLVAQLSGEASGHLKTVIMGLFKDPITTDADVIASATKKIMGADSEAIIQILVTKSNAEKQMLLDFYNKHHNRSLHSAITMDAEGDFRDFLLKLLEPRDENPNVVDHNAREDAKILYNAGEGKLGTDEKKFIHIFTRSSFPHLNAVAKHYVADGKKHHTLHQAVDSEFSGPLKTGLQALLHIAEWGILDYYADQIHKAMKGIGTNDDALIRLILLNRRNMPAFKDVFRRKYNKSLKEWVFSETSGSYREILMNMIGDT